MFLVTIDERNGEFERHSQLPNVAGTLVLLSFDTNNPLTLDETTIVGSSTISDWNYFDVIREKLDDDAVYVYEECIHFGGRGPAKALRFKLLSLLEHSPEPIILDFSDVETAASSFLDELLGRLNSKLGVEKFNDVIKIRNMNKMIQRMANVVVKDRLKVDGNY